MSGKKISYGVAIREGFEYLLANHSNVFVMGQGLWSPWYVGNTMTDLDKQFGKDRVIDTPVSESACTGAAVGASLAGMRPIVVHPRMDFMLYAMDSIVNQAAKWSHMFGGQAHPNVTIRAIINRGGEQGAQHSQALHAWFAHVPGLRVVMPASVRDARDLLIASVICPDPVIFIDDRWLYEQEDIIDEVKELDLKKEGPTVVKGGVDLTLAGCSHAIFLALQAESLLASDGISVEIIDIRVLNPFDPQKIIQSVKRTGCLLVVDTGWTAGGFSAEVIASVLEKMNLSELKTSPIRLALQNSPAPTPTNLERDYYLSVEKIIAAVHSIVRSKKR